ncbi:glycosyltransferase [Paenibacillus sp. FSL R10-2796]|uniref:glycosyltransferase n=1 Tax=Paenibacillus sp. FSL R10-2796 TaxID=2954663 RepID=UPI0030D95140
MIKLAIIIPTLDTGGAENMVAQLVSKIDQKSFDLELIVISTSNDSVVEKRIKNKDVKVTFFNKGLGFSMSTLLKIYKHLNKIKPDIIHTHLSACMYAAPWAVLKKTTILHTVHNRPIYEAHGLIRYVLKYLYKRKLAIPIAISETIAKETVELYGLSSSVVETIYNPVDVFKFSNIQPKEKINSEVVFVNVARFSRQKNHNGLIEAFYEVSKIKTNCKLILIGDGELRAEIEERVKHLGLSEKVQFTGNVLDIPQKLANADVFILSSHYEGLPLTILEAMAAGLPVISTAVGGVPDVVKENGLLVEPNISIKLTEAMIKLANNEKLREKMGKIALKEVRKFDISEVTLQYELLYKKYRRK